jgi:hypothetical protein
MEFVVLGLALIAVLSSLTWLATRVRRRGVGGEVMAVVDQVFRPTQHQSFYEIRTQDTRRPPMSAPDGE